jgi:diguanylate cyclase (GGDEF)-like protein
MRTGAHTLALACAALGVAGLGLAVHDRLCLAHARRQAHEADRRAVTDPLTGLANRAGLHHSWPALAAAQPVVAVLDLDGFKPVNDTHGHAAGDAVLITIAARLRGQLPQALIARLGGDEFVLILPADHAHDLARRAAATIATPIPIGDRVTVTVTASLGLAQAITGDLAQTLAAADAAMYRAKTIRTTIAVHHSTLDDRTTLAADPRPTVRVRDLTPSPMPARGPVALTGSRR